MESVEYIVELKVGLTRLRSLWRSVESYIDGAVAAKSLAEYRELYPKAEYRLVKITKEVVLG